MNSVSVALFHVSCFLFLHRYLFLTAIAAAFPLIHRPCNPPSNFVFYFILFSLFGLRRSYIYVLISIRLLYL
ncbi:hypothetical protein CPB83DRAFT_850962 [Crepidotus variabilis]|uniref:Uncharacterized protein n=1 Tax=Crepidotus variabilis TaxID=179855 RepID=A0A9P6EK86_9AGAR|nr:hypothetical protein CPB83DRAFT_850962 [Crepidotus variabilis]